ncbi:DUF1446 domain-containing protein [Xylaria sp. FL1042]|nr:DUF1446 domain-containing protein [Xylaria sp. FL1042]
MAYYIRETLPARRFSSKLSMPYSLLSRNSSTVARTPSAAMSNSKRAIRVANCSGAAGDPGVHMFNQAKCGLVDVITGDYLAEVNMGTNAEDMKDNDHPGWIPTAWDGLQQTIHLADEKGIKIIINGGGQNPRGLAEKTHALIKEKGLGLKVAYVDGDDLMHKVDDLLKNIKNGAYCHLDHENPEVQLAEDSTSFLDDPTGMPIICANAYLGYRAIKRGLDEGADIVICGRVADASPVIGAAAWWHRWSEIDYDQLAGALIAGHLIECSTYITGANFSGSYKYPVSSLMNLALPIVEIDVDGQCTVTKHDGLNGIITEDTVKCQLLYELQGNIYLNSDVKADITHVKVIEDAPNRITVTGIKGYPPPATTKLAVFYRGGYQCEMLLNATGFATNWKWDYQEAQFKGRLEEWGVLEKLDVLDFQRVGVPKENPDSQLSSTTYLRIFAQSKDAGAVGQVVKAWVFNGMAHFAGFHCSLDMRTAFPKPFLGYYPAIIPQTELEEAINILDDDLTKPPVRIIVGAPRITENILPRENYDTKAPVAITEFGPTKSFPLGNIALGRSGDKGGNVNLGLFVQNPEQWGWFRSYMTRDRISELMGKDWRDWYTVERVEMPEIYAVHYVVYGPLGRGVSSSRLLDGLGKGFGEFIRAVHIPIPVRFL